MAAPNLAKAREWFEANFEEVHIYDWATHPPGLKACETPNGRDYFTIINGNIVLEGEPCRLESSEINAACRWYDAVTKLYELMGNPKFLWWRIPPEFEEQDGQCRIYSRLAMTHTGPYQSYTGNPVPKFKASDNG